MLKRTLLLTVAVGLSVQAHAGDDSRKSLLFPPEGGPLAGARGQVEIEENEFEIKLEEVEPGATCTVLVENADGVLEAVGSATSSSMGRARLEFEDRLPLGVSMPDQLSGRSIEVQNADGAVILVGCTPDLRFGGTSEENKSELSRPEGTPDEDADGKLELRQEEGRRQIKVEVDGLLPEKTYDVILSDPAKSEVLGTLTTKENGSGTLCIDTVAGDALPFGVGDLDELAGLTVSVVDSDGVVVLTGQVGVAKAADGDNDDGKEGPEASGESCLVSAAADNTTRGKVEVKRDGSKFELEVEVRGLAPAAVFEVNLSSAAGESALVGSLVTSGRGRGELEIEGSLPLGVATVEELTGATLTITDADGMAVLTGITPALGDRADCGNEDEDEDDAPELEVEVEAERDGDKLEIEIEHLAPNTEYEIVIIATTGDQERIALLVTDDSGEAKVEIKNGMALPLGAASVSELVGLEVLVLDRQWRQHSLGSYPRVRRRR